jgi:imidazolonepropionase-like amidohydrolase
MPRAPESPSWWRVAEEGDRVIDLGGKTLMPGMTQGHFHAPFGAFGDGISAPVLGLEAPATYLAILASKNVQTLLRCGFTSAIGSSNGDYIDVTLKDAIGRGLIEGPRYWACTQEFMVTGDQADGENRSWFMQLGNTALVRKLDGPEAFRQATREALGRGCDIVKLSTGPGHGSSPIRDMMYMTRDELEAVTVTAHDRGKKVRAHCPSRIAILEGAKAGVDLIDHADRMDAECIDAILEADVFVLPSMLWSVRLLEIAENWDHAAAPFPIGEQKTQTLEETMESIRGVRADFEHTCQMLPEAVKAGVKLVVGDDFGTPIMPHGDYVSEMEFYVKQLGISAQEVLRWATRNGADAMDALDERGTIAAGKLADLLVVDGDPLSDITCLRDTTNLRAIMLDGKLIKDLL